MTRVYEASIKYDTNSKHPDDKNSKGFTFNDTYTVDTDSFYGNDDILSYIKRDLMLVAGGGYSTDTIKNVVLDIKQVN